VIGDSLKGSYGGKDEDERASRKKVECVKQREGGSRYKRG
jgi:hypothetical protein